MKKLEYIKDVSTGVEIVSYENADIAYPEHTHTGHYVLGIVTDGTVKIVINGADFVCHSGEMFSVALNIRHAIVPVTATYSMISICIPERDDIERDLDVVRKQILGNPEIEINIAEMSELVHVSRYHMIRKFAAENGLTPHKFQLQCRIRKAQELLAEGMKVVDVASALGFCDQSHLCRVFRKQVGISPEEYINSAILSNAKE